jgi:hypothetical protein
MPNWCWNSIVVYGSKKEVLKFRENFIKAYDQALINKHWSTYELYVVHGYDDEFIMGYKSSYIRGNIYDAKDSVVYTKTDGSNVIYWCRFFFESAWAPMYDGIKFLIENNYEELKFVLLAEECGVGIYVNTDVDHTFFSDKYCVYSEDGGSEYFENDEELIKYMKDTFNYDIEDISALYDDDFFEISNDVTVNFYRFTTI